MYDNEVPVRGRALCMGSSEGTLLALFPCFCYKYLRFGKYIIHIWGRITLVGYVFFSTSHEEMYHTML